MPRRRTSVKLKTGAVGFGAVDLHFHGAFGIDLMTAQPRELASLSSALAQHGVSAFCPTTLSVGKRELRESVSRLGRWVSSGSVPGALPLGLHLEGPFIGPEAKGAHPAGAIRPVSFDELEELWNLSRRTIRILTVAPEALARTGDLGRLIRFCRSRRIRLSLGHSRATEAEARKVFDAGFTGVTHAWNAMSFHHRAPGVLGAALGRRDVWTEIIPDGIHVDPALVRWTLDLHGSDRVCFVSDCVPAAATSARTGRFYPFGPLKIRYAGGACRLRDGTLAGGGRLLPDSYRRWVQVEARRTGISEARIRSQTQDCIGRVPLESLGYRPAEIRAILARSSLG